MTRGEGRYAIRLTPWAAAQLKDEMAWSRHRWGRQHQHAYRQALQKQLERIAAQPHSYPVRPDLGVGVRLVHHRGLYVVFLVNDALRQIEVIGFPNVHRELGRSIADSLETWRRTGSHDEV